MSGSVLHRLRIEARKHAWLRHVYHAMRQAGLLGPSVPAPLPPVTTPWGLLSLDAPRRDALRRIELISGWYLPSDDVIAPCALQVTVDGVPVASLAHTYRPDVAAAYPGNARAVRSGFMGDVVVEGNRSVLDRVTLRIQRINADRRILLFERAFPVEPGSGSPAPRPTAFDLADILQDPVTGERVVRDGQGFYVTASRPVRTVFRTPHFNPPGAPAVIRLSEPGSTHPYGDRARAIIESAVGLVLDFGVGIQSDDRLYPHVVNLDAVHFRNVDVVSCCRALPFRNGAFSAVVSQAVFEHLPDPFFAAAEILRVLRPGGLALIDTAFMQPFHGDPEHYFNMTVPGLREIMRGFEILELGVQPHQAPSLGLLMQVETVAPLLPEGRWRREADRIAGWLRREGGALDEALGAVGREVLAAGVYVLARKPVL